MRYEISESCRISFSVSFAIWEPTIGLCTQRLRALIRGGWNARRSLRLFLGICCRRVTKLVVIDDHEALRSGLEVLLSQAGLDVVGAAGNVAAGLDLIDHTDPDLALVDIRLPDGSGIDLTRQLLQRHPS